MRFPSTCDPSPSSEREGADHGAQAAGAAPSQQVEEHCEAEAQEPRGEEQRHRCQSSVRLQARPGQLITKMFDTHLLIDVFTVMEIRFGQSLIIVGSIWTLNLFPAMIKKTLLASS